MPEADTGRSRTSRVISAPREVVYQALTDPNALIIWRAPADMTTKIHDWDFRLNGGYSMSLYYPETEPNYNGKSGANEDRFSARFVEITPPSRVVEAITFDSNDPALSGLMFMTVSLEVVAGGTEVTFLFEQIPPGIRPEDNDEGARSSLEKLARHVE